MVTGAHHTREQTGEAHRRTVPIRLEVCKSYKLIPSLPPHPREGSVHEKERNRFPVRRDVKEHEVSSAAKTTFPKRMNRKGNSFKTR